MTKSDNGFYAGVDSGGTKCEILICSEDKKIISEKTYKGVHYSVSGLEIYCNTVSGFIKDSFTGNNLKFSNCKGICFGVAGAREDKDRTRLKKIFTEVLGINNVTVTTDAMTALYGAFEGKEGIILISGTGSVLYGYSCENNFNKILRVGGWGRIVGDEGSGYWIGKRALNLVSKEYDNFPLSKSLSLLSSKFYELFGIDSANLNEKIFKESFQIQDLTPVILQCAAEKCPLSNKIIKEAVEGLVYHIKTYLKISKRKKPISIAFIGSVIENRNVLSEMLEKEIGKMKLVKVTKKLNSPSFGAALLAMENSDILLKF